METTGNTLLITGGTSGIGLAFAEEFLKLGNIVIVCGRREERLEQLKKKHPQLITKRSDVSNEKDRTELFNWTKENHGGVNVLINNAGVQFAMDLTKSADLEKVRTEIETNFIAPLHLASLFAPHLATKKNAAIINISSGLAFCPIAFMPVYCATKAAVHSLTLSLRYQLRETPVKVFEIAPPSVDTELGHDRREDKAQSHGGIPVHEFLAEAMEGIKNDNFETCVGGAKGLREKREGAFAFMNK